MGRSRGGELTTKIRAPTDGRGLPLELVLTAGKSGNCPVAGQLNTIVCSHSAAVASHWKPCFSPVLDCGRKRIEEFFHRIKRVRWLAARYDNAVNFLAMLKLAAAQL